MRLVLACVGRARGPERDLAARYIERAGAAARGLGFPSVTVREFDESRARRAEDRKAEEAKAIRAAIGTADVIALDEGGENVSSREFARRLGLKRDQGAATLAIVIGGPDGLAPEFRAGAAMVLSFGAMTFPHQLVRLLAAEQIYRAVTILAGHPYHRD
ncbi:23S rRNA (pseudouridine(1915)-N(3))-methyltransferase RlmH [Methylocapsa palsarum]|uniref:Ribosomal RNA large subunit methyltransferase H n=1 Tax=Methylocapsa palsarum TaxID=1612308 RepID=A0A1I3Y5G7_9HYPH|nr:23S rRNA (pseudouridine(1915)-N(3))-methyltransferase RlmH [Methylocapsa palsarum]SFK27088.1 23S rRNA (pseudouridine1915-N3)-methyltransferase [Methylocapsa palsarum]